MASTMLSIKLLIDQERNCVILAEAGYDFVGTLCSLLMFPLGNIARLFAKHQSFQPGCLNNLYNSGNLGLNSFRTDECKRMLLYPKCIHEGSFKNMKLDMHFTKPRRFFVCRNVSCTQKPSKMLNYYSENVRCTCGELMNSELNYERYGRPAVKTETDGALYNVESMFFITDDLRVMQGLPGGLGNFLLNLGIKNFSQIEEKVLRISSKEKQGTLGSTPRLEEQFMLVVPSMETTESDGETSVKLVLRKSDRKILNAEADFVDLLFSFLTIPLVSVLELIGGSKGNMTVGSISNLFKDLDTILSITKQNNSEKGVLPPFYSCPKEFPSIRSQDPPAIVFYGFRLLNIDPKSPNPSYTNSSGYVKKNSLFMATDDLVVKSLSSVSSISLLKEIGIQHESVEHQAIRIREVEALALLWSCLCSSSALSTSLNGYVKQLKQEPL